MQLRQECIALSTPRLLCLIYKPDMLVYTNFTKRHSLGRLRIELVYDRSSMTEDEAAVRLSLPVLGLSCKEGSPCLLVTVSFLAQESICVHHPHLSVAR